MRTELIDTLIIGSGRATGNESYGLAREAGQISWLRGTALPNVDERSDRTIFGSNCSTGRSNGGVKSRPPAREDADAADGDRGALSPPAHDDGGARPQDLPVSVARDGDHPAEPSLGDGAHVRPDDAWLRLSRRRARLVQPPRVVVAADNVFVERLWRGVKYEEVYLRAYDSVSDAADVPTRALTTLRPIRRTSRSCPSAQQPNPGRGSIYRRGVSVQTNGPTAYHGLQEAVPFSSEQSYLRSLPHRRRAFLSRIEMQPIRLPRQISHKMLVPPPS